MRHVLTLCIALVVLATSALLYAWSGIYNIAATQPHWPATLSFIEMLKDRSVTKHSDGIQISALDDPDLVKNAFPHYHEMCRFCHGAPGYRPQEFAKGLYPAPPSMISGHVQHELDDAGIYWIVKHGIKMTGMPAFGPTHSDTELRGLAALARELPRMAPEQYREQVEAIEREASMGHGHVHDESEAENNTGQKVAPDHDDHEHLR